MIVHLDIAAFFDKSAPMIVIAGTLPINPDKRAEAEAACLTMAAASQAEAGCTAYRFGTSLENPNLIVLHEEWADQSSIDAHNKSAHMAAFGAALGSVLAGGPEFYRYDNDNKVSLF